ncbi:hypothetical protein GQ43DRAFT_472376 [Delitschia confertaspora ATCC 74209]|uniref:Uncharacterized protein n=1 Tax=Delitschia confertaspora ATCC 74209 TaxID=1513339 RepID=A0A9P4MRT6_9PLEO|nr:hypothetical protein GQ43DRAFT_472376 [Delitschia confertaspora ATCC 74209]
MAYVAVIANKFALLPYPSITAPRAPGQPVLLGTPRDISKPLDIAVDNLANRKSHFPDPISLAQTPFQVEIIHKIIEGFRSKSFACIPKEYKNVIFVSHSYGSLVARHIAKNYPNPKDSGDAYIQTATSTTLFGIRNASVNFHSRAASLFNPANYTKLPPAYMQVNPTSLREIVYLLNNEDDRAMLAWDIQ